LAIYYGLGKKLVKLLKEIFSTLCAKYFTLTV